MKTLYFVMTVIRVIIRAPINKLKIELPGDRKLSPSERKAQ
jgi:hypothetical protein